MEATKKTIFCVVCGESRSVDARNYHQVKRCQTHQYEFARAYNSEYIREKRKKQAREKLEKIGFKIEEIK